MFCLFSTFHFTLSVFPLRGFDTLSAEAALSSISLVFREKEARGKWKVY